MFVFWLTLLKMETSREVEDVAVLQIGPLLSGEAQVTLQKTVNILSREEADGRPEEVCGIVTSPGPGGVVNAELLQKFPSVRVVSSHGVGYNHVDVKACDERGVRVGYTPGVVSNATADLAWALILATARRVVEGHNIIHSGDFKNAFYMLGKEVSGATLGIIGMGRIGNEIARRGAGFSTQVLYHNRHRRSVTEEEAVHAQYVPGLTELLKRSDFVVSVLPATADTYHLLGREQFLSMRKDAVFINVGRGSTVDHDALVEVLSCGHLFGVGLDVTDPEPLPHGHKLLSMSNVVISPHMGTGTAQTRAAMGHLVVRNLVAGLKREPLEACVNPRESP